MSIVDSVGPFYESIYWHPKFVIDDITQNADSKGTFLFKIEESPDGLLSA